MKQSYLDLPLENGLNYFIRYELLDSLKRELEEFLEDNDSMNTLEFTKKVLFSHELQANNLVEGYGDDISVIEAIIRKKVCNIHDVDKKKRIMNLYRGYQFIMKYKKVNKFSLKKLYDVLSDGLLSEDELHSMGEFYRNDSVYILDKNIDVDLLEQGINYVNIEHLMEKYFAYFNKNDALCSTDNYIKSQILHFYFVYIHPYFDVNGRTSRTLSMWYLLKHMNYPYIIFNRGIPYHMMDYYNSIKKTKLTYDLTSFINYMMIEVKLELEKEYLVQNIAVNAKDKLTGENYQTLLYLLSINGIKTAMDFASLYNHLNDKQRMIDIYKKMIEPLIDKNILKVVRWTKNNIVGDINNVILEINPKMISCDKKKIKRLII